MKKLKFSISVFLLFLSIGLHCQSVWNRSHLEQVREHLDIPVYSIAYRQLLKDANEILAKPPVSVMMKKRVAISGDKHDYLSQARYFWPDPKSPNGLPYISLDGKSNPEINELDRNSLAIMCSRVETLSLSWFFSKNERYARKAVEQVRTWFLDKKTNMNPQFEYAQIVRGKDGDKGRSYGLIDGYSMISMLEAAQLLENSKSFTKHDVRSLKRWFAQLLDWYLNSNQGKIEREAANNHSLAYHVQVTAFALYCGKTKLADQYIDMFPQTRMFSQIEPDGKQPQELRRTLAFGYSEFNIRHMLDMFLLARRRNKSIDGSNSSDGRNFYKAVDFLMPYVGKDKKNWPYQQISDWNEKQQDFCQDLYIAFSFNPNKKNYLRLFKKYGRIPVEDRWNLLYLNPDEADNPMAFINYQLKTALNSLSKASDSTQNAQLVSPRTIEKDGSIRLVTARDWCSGFFPGMLWMMYHYTDDDFWRQQANFYTMPLAILRNYTKTHDLGFMVHNSFGWAWKLTRDKTYLDVELQAANALASRFSEKVGCIRSWDHNKDRFSYPVIIDNMMNLELLFWATQQTGDSTYYRKAVSHAKMTLKNHYRPDYSSYHVVDYDPSTGNVLKRCTFQGYADESVWSRGQAWGLYGYTMCYRFTHNKKYLKQAEHIASFIFSQSNLPPDLIPYWDMKDPLIPNSPRDVSAAAVTASALYELSSYSQDSIDYKKKADGIMNNLYKHYRTKMGSNYGFLLLHSTGNYPSNDEIDVPIIYADYYYLEALLRKYEIETNENI